MNTSMKFEEAIQELQKIADELESGNVPLEKSVELFNRGQELHTYCNNIVKGIVQHIESVDSRADIDLTQEDE